MLRTILGLGLVVATLSSSGCYLGRSPNAKAVAYVVNGSIAVGGAAIVADSQAAGDEHDLIGTIGLIPTLVGLAGIAINVAAGSEQPEQKPLPKGAQLELRELPASRVLASKP